MPRDRVRNEDIASIFEQVADLLEVQGENPFRIRSYRNAAAAISESDRQMADILEVEGIEGLERIDGIGEALARSIEEIVETGRLGLLERLRGEVSPESVLARVPGVGRELARRIHENLGIETLEQLEIAAHDGSVEEVPGIGRKRVSGIRSALAGMLGRSAIRRTRRRQQLALEPRGLAGQQARPAVATILALDEEYRAKAEAGELRTISPRRFNPRGEAWLPVMRAERDGWHFTVLFSNTARAHELGKTRDWVVMYYHNAEDDQCTVVTATRGPLEGKRVIRGRERECREYYEKDEG